MKNFYMEVLKSDMDAEEVVFSCNGEEKHFYSRPQGEWIDEGQYAEGHSEHAYHCKKCGYHIIELPNTIFENRYCKNCGAKMRGEEK